MSIEQQIQQALAARADSLTAAPDGRDLARRLHKAQRRAQRKQLVLVSGALVVIAGSSGAVLGAIATRPGGSTQSLPPQTVDTNVSAAVTTTTTSVPGLAPLPTSGGPPGSSHKANAAKGAAPQRSEATLDGLPVEWLTTPLAAPVTVASPGSQTVCLDASVVTASVGGDTPFAGGSGVLGLPRLEPAGLAVVSSGSFGSLGHLGGWWAIVETGSSASSVAVQFPSGITVHEQVSHGVSVLAALASPAAAAAAARAGTAYTTLASAVAYAPAGVTSSLEFILGAPPTAVDAAPASPKDALAASAGCIPASGFAAKGLFGPQAAGGSAAGGRAGGGATGGGSGGSPTRAVSTATAGPPAPVNAAGEVVGAFEQAYDLNPLLGLEWSFGAVDLRGASHCSLGSLHPSTSATSRLVTPAVTVDAVAFVSPTQAVVIYERGSGLRNTGTAVLSGGSWKVSGATYCQDMASSPTTP